MNALLGFLFGSVASDSMVVSGLVFRLQVACSDSVLVSVSVWLGYVESLDSIVFCFESAYFAVVESIFSQFEIKSRSATK